MDLTPPTHDLFISYADADRAWVKGYLLDALTAAGIAAHTEQAFTLGQPRLTAFEEAIRHSRKVLLIVSPAYLADETATFVDLLAQHFGLETATWPVIPLILRTTPTLPTRLAMLQSLDATDPDGWDTVVARLCIELSAPTPEVSPVPPCPYPGMRPFTTEQANAFYGRDTEIADAVDRLRLHPFLTVIGPSGSGKSSLVFAGIIPALHKSTLFGSGPWTVRSLRPGVTPLTELGRTVELSAPVPAGTRLLLIIDQFEETFTLAKEEAIPFQQTLLTLMEVDDLYLVLTVRADFYPDLMGSPLWESIQKRRLEVTSLGETQLREAIVRPAENVGVFIEAALVERLVADAADEPGVLPLVQETLVLLWEKVERRFLPLRAYKSLILSRGAYGSDGRTGLQVAISRRADDVYADLPDGAQPIARRIFLRLVHFGEGRADTRRQQTVDDLRASGDDPALFDLTLTRLTESRLLTTSGDVKNATGCVQNELEESTPLRAAPFALGDANSSVQLILNTPNATSHVDISHEALISGWGLLQSWLGEKREAEGTRRGLEEKVAEWERLNRSGGLLDEFEVQEAEIWLDSDYSTNLGHSVEFATLLQVSKTALTQAQAEKIAAERNRQRSRLLAGGLALAIAIIALVAYFAVTAQSARNTAEIAATAEATARLQAVAESQKSATSEAEAIAAKATAVAAKAQVESLTRGIRADQLTSNALQVVDESPPLALLLAVEGLRSQNDYTRTSPYTDTRIVYDFDQAMYMTRTQAIAGRETVVNSAQTNMHELLGIVGGIPLIGHESGVYDVSFSPDGQWLATGSGDGTVRLWHVTNPTQAPQILASDESGILAIAFSPDGHWVATGSRDGAARLWDVTDLTVAPQVLRGHKDAVQAVAFSPDGRWLATGSLDNTVRLWDTNNLAQAPQVLYGHDLWVWAVGLQPERPLASQRLV